MKKFNSRRKFIKNSMMMGMALPVLGNSLISCTSKSGEADSQSGKKLSILILGGTSFLGPHQIAAAMAKGHSVTTFTRGKTKPTIHQELFKDVEPLIGYRESDLTALENRQWDVVIDNSGQNSEWTKNSANLLKDNVGLYLYTSSTGVYYPYLEAGVDEDTPVLLEDPVDPENTDPNRKDSYGVMKAKSERATIEAFGADRSIISRPTYMTGPADKTDRFIYWPVRLSRGGEIMVPGKPEDPVQYIDVRDVAEWNIRTLEEKTTGTFNAIGPANPEAMMEFVNKAKAGFDAESTFINIDDYQFLKDNGVSYIIPWIMPEGDYYGSARISNQRAIKSGLTFRDLKETLTDTYEWWNSDVLTQERRDQFEQKPESILIREQSIIESWKEFKKA
ncbi:MAG: NAD-dependent epimerase/dehydratase family protein [Cyclobacteriaceae bacterium]